MTRRLKSIVWRLAMRAVAIAERTRPSDPSHQFQLIQSYRALIRSGAPLPTFRDAGFRVFSQTDEDGILLYLFAILGTTNRKCVEICAGDGLECNTANLIVHHGWNGLLVDGDPHLVARGREFYGRHPSTYAQPPAFVHEWITRDRVNELMQRHHMEGEIDLLALDLDGVDYWIWDALEVTRPRVVVVEYQDIIGPVRSLTVPYSDHFDSRAFPMTNGAPNFAGASLPAFCRLANRKGYRLVGCNRLGYNAFFVARDLAPTELKEVSVESCLSHPHNVRGMKERWPTVAALPWVEV